MGSDAFTNPTLNSTNFGITSTSTDSVNYWPEPGTPSNATDGFTNSTPITDSAATSRPYIWKYL